MTQEQKARRYDEAVSMAKKFYTPDSNNVNLKATLGMIFPELAESEDELTWLTKYIEEEAYSLSIDIRDDEDRIKLKKLQKALAWLEKQNAQEEPQVYETCDGKIITYSETDGYKINEPKFNVGDWIVANYGKVNQIVLVYKDGEGYILDDGTYIKDSWSEMFHLWTIQDAKDGDVLAEDSCTFIIKRMKPDGTAIIHCCLFDDGDFALGSTLSFDINSTYPATKEQHNTLFEKMIKAGYVWDAEKKELKNIRLGRNPTEEKELLLKDLEWVDMETNECHCYNCELFDSKSNDCKCIDLCKRPKNTYKGFYKNNKNNNK